MTRRHDPFRPVGQQWFDDDEVAVEPAPEPEPKLVAGQVSEELPVGTTKELLAWVGDDKDRAKKILDLEQKDDKPRAGLVKALKEILDA